MLGRPLYASLIKSLALNNGKMAFVAGPRQVGKTTLAETIAGGFSSSRYFNWDDVDFRKLWALHPREVVPKTVGPKHLVILDELHKAPRWKNTLKGVYDHEKKHALFIVTGSAKLDVFRRGGESLVGRYFLFRLHPFSVGELAGTPSCAPGDLSRRLEKHLPEHSDFLEKLETFGGFPDPLSKADGDYRTAWSIQRLDRVIREDLMDLSFVRQISQLQTLAALLPERVGSPLSLQSLAEDLELNHPTIKRWIGLFEALYFVYSLSPHSRSLARGLKKQSKTYLWDWSEIHDEGARFENLVASHFLKACHFWTDSGKGRFELRYVRDKEKREVDFLILKDNKPWLLAEAKISETAPASALKAFAKTLNPEIVLQIVKKRNVHEKFALEDGKKRNGYIVSADKFFGLLP